MKEICKLVANLLWLDKQISISERGKRYSRTLIIRTRLDLSKYPDNRESG